MGKSDIVASLKLNSTDYEQKLAKAKESTRKFSKDGGQGLADMMGKFTKLAGAVVASKAAMEVFNAAIKSSQTIGDEYTRIIESAKGSVGEFVYAMANADFSGFNDGLRGIISNARDAASAMDSLGNAQISFDYLTAGYRSDFKTNMGLAKDKNLGLGERQAAYDAALGSLDQIGEAVKVYTDKTVAAVVANAKAKGNNIDTSFITRGNIDRVFSLDITAGGEEEKARLAERYKEFKKLKSQEEKLEKAVSVARLNGYDSEAQYTQRLAEVRAKIHSDDYQMAALYNAMLVKGTDEWLKGLADLVIKADNANASYQELKTSSLEVANALRTAGVEAAKLSAEAASAAEKEKAVLANISANNPAKATMAGLGEGAGASALPVTLESVEPVILYADAYKTLEETAVSASEGLGALGGAMGNLSGMLGEGAGAWMSYAGGIVSAIGSALPSLEALAAAQAAAAVTKTALSPWTVISGIAAVTSIVAAMAQLPKFATGGVVPGNALSGDNVLIRANSGEVVLTKQQANNIGSMLSGGLGGKVVFKIEGSTLVGVLNNHNQIAGRSYGHKNG